MEPIRWDAATVSCLHIKQVVAAPRPGFAHANIRTLPVDAPTRVAAAGWALAAAACPRPLRPIEAALANGVLEQSDETDDSHGPSQSHPGPVVPAALALGEKFGIDGTRFLRAVTLGCDIGPRMTMAMGGAAFMSSCTLSCALIVLASTGCIAGHQWHKHHMSEKAMQNQQDYVKSRQQQDPNYRDPWQN